MPTFSREYIASLALVLASVLKIFGIELENGVVEGLLAGVVALAIAVWRKSRGDIDVLGRKSV